MIRVSLLQRMLYVFPLFTEGMLGNTVSHPLMVLVKERLFSLYAFQVLNFIYNILIYSTFFFC